MTAIANKPTARWIRRLAAVLVIVAAASMVSTSTAGAASFSKPIPPQRYVIGDCTVWVGPVYDQWNAQWHSIGGTYVSCATNKASLTATVAEVYSQNGSTNWYYTGQQGSLSGRNISGWNDIIHTSGVCGTGYWYTRAWITINGITYQRDSTPAYAPTGCRV